MGYNLFDEPNRVNATYCAAHGMAAVELYGTEPNRAEFETYRLIGLGVPADAADPYMDRVNAERLRVRKLVVNLQRKIRLQNMGYAPSRFKRLVNRERYIRGMA